jgi:hypothetical protein
VDLPNTITIKHWSRKRARKYRSTDIWLLIVVFGTRAEGLVSVVRYATCLILVRLLSLVAHLLLPDVYL